MPARAESPPADALRRLSPADVQQLAHERVRPHVLGECPWLLVFDGPAPSLEELRAHVAERLVHLPALRTRLRPSPLPLARPFWEADPEFDLARHVVAVDEERYEGEEGWLRFVGRRAAEPLDRDRPLWQMTLLRGDPERFAVVLYHHHAVGDGHSGLRVMRTLFGARPPSAAPPDPAPTATVTDRELLRREARDVAAALRAGRRAVRARGDLAERARDLAALGRSLAPGGEKVPELNQRIGPRRRALALDIPMDAVGAALRGFGCVPNEVWLTALGGGLTTWLGTRGVPTAGRTVNAGTAINIARDKSARKHLGNHWSGVRVPVPLGPMAPEERLRRVQAQTRRLGEGRLARGGAALLELERALPRQALGLASRIAFLPRNFNVGASHMAAGPGLGELLGRPLERLHSWTFLYADHAVTFVTHVAVGRMTVNALVDPDLVPDADVLMDGIRASVHELAERAEAPVPVG